jgi:hypothetical protein
VIAWLRHYIRDANLLVLWWALIFFTCNFALARGGAHLGVQVLNALGVVVCIGILCARQWLHDDVLKWPPRS